MNPQQYKILVIDEDSSSEKFLAKEFEDLDFVQLKCKNLDKALSILSTQNVDLIILDLSVLPSKNKLESFRLFKSNLNTLLDYAPPVMVISAQEESSIEQDIILSGAVDHVNKNNPAALSNALVKSLSLSQANQTPQDRLLEALGKEVNDVRHMVERERHEREWEFKKQESDISTSNQDLAKLYKVIIEFKKEAERQRTKIKKMGTIHLRLNLIALGAVVIVLLANLPTSQSKSQDLIKQVSTFLEIPAVAVLVSAIGWAFNVSNKED